jgi:prepilin-type processing-associated H-X9-DG protein
MLVVITIVAILAALLLPAIGRLRGEAQSASCINNLRQISVMTGIYAIDHNDCFSPAWTRLGDGTWLDYLIAFTQFGGDFPATHAAMGTGKLGTRCPTQLLTDAQCSATFRSACGIYSGTDNWWYDYGINYQGLTPVNDYTTSPDGVPIPAPIRRVAVRNPSKCIYVADGNIADGGIPWLIHPTWSAAYPADRHNGFGHVLWVDGHVTSESRSTLTDPANINLWYP